MDAAEFHYKFIRIHPFDDGNGRTARILMNFILMQFGFPPVIIKTEDKVNYFAALQLADAGNIEPFINYIAINLNRSLEIMIAGANGEDIEEDVDLDKEIALLEQRLSGFSERIDKEKSIENIHNIFKNSILIIADEIRKKLNKFNDYYLFKNIFIVNDNKSYILSEASYPEGNCKVVKIVLNYNTLKKKGLEDFRFYMDFSFKFDLLSYCVFESNYEDNILYKKDYENLSEKETKQLIKHAIIHHNSLLNEALNKTNP